MNTVEPKKPRYRRKADGRTVLVINGKEQEVNADNRRLNKYGYPKRLTPCPECGDPNGVGHYRG